MTRPARHRPLLALLLGVALLGGCQTYVGRFVRLRALDADDFRRLPSRAIAATPDAVPLTMALDSSWLPRVAIMLGTRRLTEHAAFDSLLSVNGTTAFIILHRGQVVHERYYLGADRDSLSKSFSVSKSVLSALIGIAQADSLLRTGDSVGAYVDLPRNPALAAVRVSHLLDNVSGFRYRKGFAPWKEQPRMYYTPDARGYVSDAQVVRAPGTQFDAEELSPILAGFVLEQALRRARADSTLAHYMQIKLWQPMGAQYDALWNIDHAGDGLEKTESGLVARAIDLARFGQLYLDGGTANGVQVVPADWVAATVTPPVAGAPNLFSDGFYHNLWWGAARKGRIRSDFYANGHFGQRIYVSPDKQLVIVRMGRVGGDINWTNMLGGIADRW
ncbi:MAG: serine hydrolase domain-containing protein [Gemmatimonadaceae bacterium]